MPRRRARKAQPLASVPEKSELEKSEPEESEPEEIEPERSKSENSESENSESENSEPSEETMHSAKIASNTKKTNPSRAGMLHQSAVPQQSVKAEGKELQACSMEVMITYGSFEISRADLTSLSNRLEYLLDELEEAKRARLVRVRQVALVRMHNSDDGGLPGNEADWECGGGRCKRCQVARETEDFDVRVDVRQCEQM